MTVCDMEELSMEVKIEADHDCTIVQLSPFQHQVGGHTFMMIYDEKTVCKPLDENEHRVYSHFPDELKQFIPELYGVVKVHYERCGDDILCFALPLDCSYCKDLKRLKNYLIAKDALTKGTLAVSKDSDQTDNGSEWNVAMKKRLLAQWNHIRGKRLQKFILLENVSKHFRHPCVLDLKMGTRGFGDYATTEKRLRHQQRVQSSTSGSLGVRLCGMQVYHPCKSAYIFTDKYQGRRFTKEDFQNCMKDYLYNGTSHRVELIKPLITKLKTLLYQLENIECYRFYCSSLLLVYDGHITDDAEIEVRMIDFAHTRIKAEESNHHIGPDRGYILGVKSLIDIYTQLSDVLLGKQN